MRKYILILLSTLLLSVNAQIINNNFPKGIYSHSESISNSNMRIVIEDAPNLYLNALFSGIEFSIRANYTQIGDTIEAVIHPLDIYADKDELIPDQLYISVEGMSGFFNEINLQVFKNSDTIPLDISKNPINWNFNDTLKVSLESSGDSYMSEYTIPTSYNKLTLKANSSLRDIKDTLLLTKTEFPNVLKIDNKRDRTNSEIHIFYTSPSSAFESIHSGYLLFPSNIKTNITEKEEDFYSIYLQNNNINIYTEYDKALEKALEENRLLRVYTNFESGSDSIPFKTQFEYLRNSYYIYVSLTNQDQGKSIKIISPQEDIIYCSDSIEDGSILFKDENSLYDISGYISAYNRILDAKIAKPKQKDLKTDLQKYFSNYIYLSDTDNDADSITNANIENYIKRYINEFSKNSKDSILYNVCLAIHTDKIENMKKDSIMDKIPESMKYLLHNRNAEISISPQIKQKLYSYIEKPVLPIFFLSIYNNRNMTFSYLKEAVNLLPEYKDYIYMAYLSSKIENLTDNDFLYIKKHFDPIVHEIESRSKSPLILTVMDVINERAKKMYEFDQVNLLTFENQKYLDIYEISSAYNEMFSTIFNNLAWRGYKNKSTKYLDDFVKYSKFALDLDPNNHYFLDTYAHLLYMQGNIEQAIDTEKLAYERALNDTGKHSRETRLYKLMLHAMKNGTLEKYNTEEWNFDEN